MIKALIIADDFTGALDTGVKFAAAGALTKVITDTETDFHADTASEVLVLCAPTRHLPPRAAYDLVRRITERAAAAGVGCIIKKTDSALRGNIGAELQAVLDGSGAATVNFIPALPAMNRITAAGIHYIDGTPVAESVFGKDPFEPVTESYIPDLIRLQSSTPTVVVSAQKERCTPPAGAPCIRIFDCGTREEMDQLVQTLRSEGQLHLVAGCAGLAQSLPPYLDLTLLPPPQAAAHSDRLTVICGSLNPISRRQLDLGEQAGYPRLHLPMASLLAEDDLWDLRAVTDPLWDTCRHATRLIVDTLTAEAQQAMDTASQPLEALRSRVAARIGMVLKDLLDRGLDSRILIIGGDTLLAFLEAIDCSAITPVCELQQGVVLSRITYRGREYEVVSKSGGFGKEDLLMQI